MAAIIKRYVLKGHYAGKTINLGGFPFLNGVLTAQLEEEDHQKVARFIAQWRAEVDDGKCNPEEDSTRKVDGNVQSNGEGAEAQGGATDGNGATGAKGSNKTGQLDSKGNGQTEVIDPMVERIREAVRSLDPGRDVYWTRDGKPQLSAVEAALGFSGLTRAQLDACVPGYNRSAAIQQWSAKTAEAAVKK